MDIEHLIISRLRKSGSVKTADIVKATGFSRVYVNRVLRGLRDEGLIVLFGKANKAHYVLASRSGIARAKKGAMEAHCILKNEGLSEDIVLDGIRKDTGIFMGLSDNVSRIAAYAFTEMLNNAIEHSRARQIEVLVQRSKENIRFKVIDKGIGIFNSIIGKRHLAGELEAIQDLMKGKLTTSPESHTGEGIFFTSRAVDILIIESSKKKLIFNNLLEDIFIKNIKETRGTKIICSIDLHTGKRLEDIFKGYTDDSFEFSKTEAKVRLYQHGTEYISRSQARRILEGLDKFKTVKLDFAGVESVGQGFADEVFRVWKTRHPASEIIPVNANENILFMINRAKAGK